MTITWHVDSLKISHVDTYEVKKLIDWAKGIYGSHMEESGGKKKNYLGMDLGLSID